MRAATVRLDAFAGKITAEYQAALGEKLCAVNPALSFALFEFANKAHIDFAVAFTDIPQTAFAKALACFKSPRAFLKKMKANRCRRNSVKCWQCSGCLFRAGTKTAAEFLRAGIEAEFGELILQMTQETADFYLSLLFSFGRRCTDKTAAGQPKSLAELL